MRLRVGDRVLVKDIEEQLEHLVGKEAIVVDVNPDYEYPIELKFIDRSNEHCPELYKEDELELVDEGIILKERFIRRMKEVNVPKIITIAVRLPSGAIETITNTTDTVTKAMYYTDAYDDEFRLKSNPDVQIVGFMIV